MHRSSVPGSTHAQIVIANELSELARVSRLTDEFAREHGLAGDVVADVQVALDEALANIVRHGRGEGAREISVQLRVREDAVEIVIEDDGEPFDPLSVQPASPGTVPYERAPGGLGIHFMKKLMSEIQYARVGTRNRLMLRRRLGAQR